MSFVSPVVSFPVKLIPRRTSKEYCTDFIQFNIGNHVLEVQPIKNILKTNGGCRRLTTALPNAKNSKY